MKNNEIKTSLYHFDVVDKDHPCIVLRGWLDHLQALILQTQALLYKEGQEAKAETLQPFLTYVRQVLKAEVLNQPFTETFLLGLTSEELREESYQTTAFFPTKKMALPYYKQGLWAIQLNVLRTSTRQAEIAAVVAYKSDKPVHLSIVTALNRLSSAFYLLFVKATVE